ncbi:MAG: hypothetical protein E4H22_05135 [Solirubrobacterales bacterium]|nr:MAG: hypothetical protein E4H22_05135 [Solirubrobacterales bacterium]
MQAGGPCVERLGTAEPDRAIEEGAIEGGAVTVEAASGKQDLPGRRLLESELGSVEERRLPDLRVLGILGVELGEADDLEADRGSVAGRPRVQVAELLADSAPVLGRLAVIDATELQRRQPVVLGGMADVEARPGIARAVIPLRHG